MKANAQLIQKFYTCFHRRDAQGMLSCYHDEVEFSDAIFTHLQGARAKAMWRMQCERGKDWKSP